MTGSSFGFRVTRERWEEPDRRSELPLRTIEAVQLLDVSPVTFPQYTSTTATVRTQADEMASRRARLRRHELALRYS